MDMTAKHDTSQVEVNTLSLVGTLSEPLKYSISTTVDLWDEILENSPDCSPDILDELYEACTYSLQLIAPNGKHKKIRELVHKILKHPNASRDLLDKTLKSPLSQLREVKNLDFSDPEMLPWFFKLPAMEAALQNCNCPEEYLLQACGSPFVSLRRIAAIHPGCPTEGHVVAALLGI